MAGSSVISPVNNKIKSRNTYLRMKSCSPKFKTILRQRHRERIESSRFKVVNGFRNLNLELNPDELEYLDLLSCITPFDRNLCKELLQKDQHLNLDEELKIEEIVKNELSQYENWLLQEYQYLGDEEDTSEIIVTCPLCCSGHFQSDSLYRGRIFCSKCSSSFFTLKSMVEIQSDIFNEVDEHNSHCYCNPYFVSVPADEFLTSLCIVCDKCTYMQVII